MIDEKQMTLATDWTGQNLSGWLASEKLNGCCLVWDGADTREFWTRLGRVVKAPAWFKRGLPRLWLQGELWAGRDGRFGMDSFQVASNAVRLGGHWFDDPRIRFTVLDANVPGAWTDRIAEAVRAVRGCRHADAIQFETAPREGYQFGLWLSGYAKRNAEGVMFRNPAAIGYETGRSKNLRRCKFLGNEPQPERTP